MKISKLFHWLYGFLMCLPIFAVAFTCLYVTFNPNAKDSYLGTYSYEATQNINQFLTTTSASIRSEAVVNSVTNYKIDNYNLGGNYYSINLSNFDFAGSITNQSQLTFNVSYLKINNDEYINAKSFNLQRYNSTYSIFIYDVAFNYETMYSNLRSASSNYYLNQDGNTTATSIRGIQINISNMNINSFTFINADNNLYYRGDYTWGKIFEKNIFLIDNTLSSVFYSSVSIVRNTSLFGWASNSFLNTPITYLSNLFGMPSDSPIITYLSYWLNISVIWLAFDLVMYVPLLAHRWIDKGIKE